MEKTYLCVGCTYSYGYNHGMIEYDFIVTDDVKEAIDRAEELSIDVVEEYFHILADNYEDVDEDEEVDADTVFSDEACAECYVVNIDKDVDELFSMVDMYCVEEFIDRYCEPV